MAEIYTEARKAYRFLFDYQTRVLDLMDFIGKSYALQFILGTSLFSNTVPKKGKLNLWSWDWLPMYNYEFYFEQENDLGKLQFSVILVNDTGFYDSEVEKKNPNKLDLDSFNEINNSNTELIFLAGQDSWWDGWLNELEEIVFKRDYGKVEDRQLIFQKYSLSEFETQEEALKCIEDFSKTCLKYGINLKISELNLNHNL